MGRGGLWLHGGADDRGQLVLTAAGTDAYLDLQEQETEQWPDDDIIFSGGGTGPTNLAYSAGGAGDDLLIAQHGWARLSGGNGHDVFQVRPVDALIIEDFKPGVDKLDFGDNPRWDTFGELMGFASQQGADVVFQFDSASATVTLQNVQMSQLRSADFIF